MHRQRRCRKGAQARCDLQRDKSDLQQARPNEGTKIGDEAKMSSATPWPSIHSPPCYCNGVVPASLAINLPPPGPLLLGHLLLNSPASLRASSSLRSVSASDISALSSARAGRSSLPLHHCSALPSRRARTRASSTLTLRSRSLRQRSLPTNLCLHDILGHTALRHPAIDALRAYPLETRRYVLLPASSSSFAALSFANHSTCGALSATYVPRRWGWTLPARPPAVRAQYTECADRLSIASLRLADASKAE
ncbi:hypothetical protein BV20DRAFT_96355 [Pilatotrama ljubarskyi]|nr:hypothetical protein BV20DRAFT_96355 [Pilatotrama ljubarskyi]